MALAGCWDSVCDRCSVTTSCLTLLTPWTAAHQAPLSFTISQSLSTEPVMLSNQLILCHPLLLLPSVFPSIMFFSNELVLHIRWPKCWSFYFSISPSNNHLGFISFKIDCFDVLAVQGTLKSFPAPHFKSINASVLNHLKGPTHTSARDYWKSYCFDYIFVSKVISLFFFFLNTSV